MENIELLKIENKILKERLKRLYKSKIIRMYDKKDYKTGQYLLDISTLDNVFTLLVECINTALKEVRFFQKVFFNENHHFYVLNTVESNS